MEGDDQGNALHHTMSKILVDRDQIHAFQSLLSTYRLLVNDDGLDELIVEEAACLLIAFASFQREGRLATSRFVFEKGLRKLANLIRPGDLGANIVYLHPDVHDEEPF